MYLWRAADHMRSTGESVPRELLRHVAPLGWNHISLIGDYLWTPIRTPDGGFRSLNNLEDAA